MDPNQAPQTPPETPEQPVVTPVVSEEAAQPTPINAESVSPAETSHLEVEPAPTTNFFGSQAEPVTPVTPLSPPLNDAISTTPLTTIPVASVPTAVVAKKSKLWLWVTLGAVLIVIIGLVVGYVVVKGAGDTAATTYTAKAKSYVQDLYDTSTTAAPNPSDLVTAMKKVDKPVLENVFLSSLSANYSTAQSLDKEVVAKVTTVEGELSQYGNVYSIYNGILDTDKDPNLLSKDYSTYLNAVITRLGKVKALSTYADVPSDVKASADSLFTATDAYKADVEDMLAAKTEADYTAAYNKAVTVSGDFVKARLAISTYYQDLATKVNTSAKELQTYADTIK